MKKMKEKKELVPLVLHPVLRLFIRLKWRSLKCFFYTNLIFQVILGTALTLHILWMTAHWDIKCSWKQVAPNSRMIVAFLLVILFLRDIFCIFAAPKMFFRNPKNYLDVLLILFTGYVLVENCNHSCRASLPPAKNASLCPQFGAAMVLISWLKVLLLLTVIRCFSAYIEMLDVVLRSFLKLIRVYFIIISAFSISFFILFRDCTVNDEGCSDFAYTNLVTSWLKTFVVITVGELDWGSVPFTNYHYRYHIYFTVIFCLVAIVLLNLLNALAVHDIKEIHNEAKHQFAIARLDYVCSLKELLEGLCERCGIRPNFLSNKILKLKKIIKCRFSVKNKIWEWEWKVRKQYQPLRGKKWDELAEKLVKIGNNLKRGTEQRLLPADIHRLQQESEHLSKTMKRRREAFRSVVRRNELSKNEKGKEDLNSSIELPRDMVQSMDVVKEKLASLEESIESIKRILVRKE